MIWGWGKGGPEFQKYHPDFQLGTYICIWVIWNGIRPKPAHRNVYPPTALQLHYTKEISRNTKENFRIQYFEILSC